MKHDRTVHGAVRRIRCVPPAMLRDPADKLDGDGILDETPGTLGLLLWCTAADVTLWGATPKEVRGGLFWGGTADGRFELLLETEVPEQVSAAVDTLHGMLSVPDGADEEIVALCCLELAAWARGSGLPRTATAFALAGAVAAPAFSDAALCVGVYARAAGQDARSETWLRRAFALARRERNRVAYTSALVELGAVYESRGNAVRAERFYRLAFRAARRYATRGARTRAIHGLVRLARQRGDHAAAAQFALSAPRLLEPVVQLDEADLLLDLARLWTDLGEPARARWALRRLVPALLAMPPSQQLAALALTARARATRGHARRGIPAARAAWALLVDDGLPDDVRYSAALDLAHAARVEGHFPTFQRAARLVLRLAPREEFPAARECVAKLWPAAEQPSPMDRAS